MSWVFLQTTVRDESGHIQIRQLRIVKKWAYLQASRKLDPRNVLLDHFVILLADWAQLCIALHLYLARGLDRLSNRNDTSFEGDDYHIHCAVFQLSLLDPHGERWHGWAATKLWFDVWLIYGLHLRMVPQHRRYSCRRYAFQFILPDTRSIHVLGPPHAFQMPWPPLLM